MRCREVFIREGYDGEYGVIKVFDEGEVNVAGRRDMLFSEMSERSAPPPRREFISFDLEVFRQWAEKTEERNRNPAPQGETDQGELATRPNPA